MNRIQLDKMAASSIAPLAAVFLLGAAALAADQRVNEMLALQQSATGADRRAQAEIDILADETQEAVSEYRVRLQELDRIRRYNDNLQRTIDDQDREKASLTRQIDEFGGLEQGIVPLLMDMINDLERFIELDVPFQIEQRRGQVTRLRDLMDRADISIAEKYRNVMGAYQDEASIGRNMEAYTGELEIGGVARQVDFLRVGRLLLAYQTPDREKMGYWNMRAGEWRELDSSYRGPLTIGLRMARRLVPPDILTLPIAAPEGGRT
ncbi:MAG: DUF3450 domain-containing protein [Gammaproteobacteria bacterium]|nr:DUF3450 domain-containing protein [Gammaproteobacteria bacterium]MCY4165155.1 DUF3450 domain-containing protein [Gammaproteobacteria bacterium]MCY4256402.1 DUF3450 domain-containing protein [Gammaproteobacteria bacterium]MCY4339831.1 DUF3450 domain-containing protein [Gammaproteobacteria bacterium]